jgi:ribosomal protein S8
MSTLQNDNYLEDMQEEFAYATANRREEILEELRNEGFIDEADVLEFEESERLRLAGDDDSEDEYLQDKEI